MEKQTITVEVKCLVCGKVTDVIMSIEWDGWRFSGVMPEHECRRATYSMAVNPSVSVSRV